MPDELGALDDDPLSFDSPDVDPIRSPSSRRSSSLESLDESLDAASLDGLDSDFDDFFAIVGLEEAGSLERDADRREDLLDGEDLARVGMGDLGEGRVGERLLDFDRFAGLDELVDVRWHRS